MLKFEGGRFPVAAICAVCLIAPIEIRCLVRLYFAHLCTFGSSGSIRSLIVERCFPVNSIPTSAHFCSLSVLCSSFYPHWEWKLPSPLSTHQVCNLKVCTLENPFDERYLRLPVVALFGKRHLFTEICRVWMIWLPMLPSSLLLCYQLHLFSLCCECSLTERGESLLIFQAIIDCSVRDHH